MKEFELLSWNKLHRDIIKLCSKIEESKYEPEILVAIARGGWVIGRIVSDILEIDNITDLHVSFYEDIKKTKKEPIILEGVGKEVKDKRVLIVDDISDTGESLRISVEYVKSKNPSKIKVATLYVKPWTKFWPDYYVRETDKWIIYPYEVKETVKKLWNRWSSEGKDGSWIENELMKIGIPRWQIKTYLKDFIELRKSR